MHPLTSHKTYQKLCITHQEYAHLHLLGQHCIVPNLRCFKPYKKFDLNCAGVAKTLLMRLLFSLGGCAAIMAAWPFLHQSRRYCTIA